MSSFVNKVKDVLTGDSHKNTTNSHSEGTSGPHSSHAANATDPRVDSDRDHRAGNTIGSSTTTHGTHSTHNPTDNYSYGQGPNTTAGPHSSNIANKIDPRVGSDRDGSHNTTSHTGGPLGSSGLTGSHGTAGHSSGLTGSHGTAGHSSGLTGSHGTTGTGTGFGSSGHSTNAGPHSSNVANMIDPRVDSDRDGRSGNNYGSSTGTSGLTGSHGTSGTSGLTGSHGTSGLTGSHGTSGLTGSHGTHGTHTGTLGSTGNSTSAGPHSSNIANKLDPRVDSDRDGRSNVGGNTYGSSTGTSGLTGSHGTHSTGIGSTNTYDNTSTYGNTGTDGSNMSHGTAGIGSTGYSNTSGPHGSNVANKLDPRVDSDRDGSQNIGGNNYGSTGSGLTGSSGTHGSSGLTGTHGTHGTTGGLTGSSGTYGNTGTHGTHNLTSSNPGPAPNTAGPHKSDALNKLDPRVDSDRDGSKTVGGDKTYSRPDGTLKDPTDAAQVPPSVLQKHLGPPIVAHDDDTHDHSRRHSVSHQEKHRGL